MDFLRRHMFYIGCGLAGVGGIVISLLGLRAMPSVMAGMEEAKTVYGQLQSLESQPVNERRVELEERRIEVTLDDCSKVIAKAKELYNTELLVPAALPEGGDHARRQFRKVYEQAMDRLFASLGSGLPANDAEIRIMKQRIADAEAAAEELGGERPPTGAPLTPSGVLTPAGAWHDAAARAHMAAAQRIYCYAIPLRLARPPRIVASLDYDYAMRDTGSVDAPFPEDVWRAQVGYWVQKDVVEAIVALNEEAAEEAKRSGEDLWVGIMPVKDVISIRMSEYILESDEEAVGGPPGGENESLPCGNGNTVFTRSVTSPDGSYEVVQYSLKLVMDQRDIPGVINRLSRNSFDTLLRVAYASVPPNREMQGKIYGSEPVVSVVLDFERVMLGEVFRPLMPEAVCEYLEIDCAAFKGEKQQEEED